MAIPIEFRQATDVPCALINLKKVETMKGNRSGCNWLLHGEPEGPITEEYLINTIKILVGEEVFDGTQNDLFCWHIGFCLGMLLNKTIPRAEGE